jgi:protein-disulfide isomerase
MAAALVVVLIIVASCIAPIQPSVTEEPAAASGETAAEAAAPEAAPAQPEPAQADTASGESTSAESTQPTEGEAVNVEEEAQPAQPQIGTVISAEPTESYKGIPVGFTDDGYPYRGEPDAPITMFEFSDYQCPFCNRYFVQTEPALDEAYVRSGQVRVVFRDYPIVELHPNAPAAHLASVCVAEQGSAELYWELHAALFRSVEEWQASATPNDIFARLAEEAGADVAQLQSCLADPAQTALVDERVNQAVQLGYNGTPTFQFLRHEDGAIFTLVGAQSFDTFAELLDAVLAGETPQTEEPQAQQEGSNEVPFWATAEGWTPDPDRPGYNMAGDQYRGNLDASVTIVEFSDFQCPYCKRHVEQTQPALDATFVDTGKVLWVFKHFPLSIHPQAPAAGVAAECAAEQGQFWEMYHLLFKDTTIWSIPDPSNIFIDLAGQLSLDTEAFAACLEDTEIASRVDSDMQEGAQFVRGTPTFIIIYGNQGSIIPGALPEERFVEILNGVLDEVGAN